jgi:hypothetical protein
MVEELHGLLENQNGLATKTQNGLLKNKRIGWLKNSMAC